MKIRAIYSTLLYVSFMLIVTITKEIDIFFWIAAVLWSAAYYMNYEDENKKRGN